MRTFLLYLITAIGVTACGLSWSDDVHAQLGQAIKDYVHDRPLQYAPSDPWTRSRLFIKHTKHYGFGYNCDGEECKRNSPYIKWQTHHENDLPACPSCRQRLNQTLAEVKQRIADGSCETGYAGHACETGHAGHACQSCGASQPCGASDLSIPTGECTSCRSHVVGRSSSAKAASQPPLPVVVSEPVVLPEQTLSKASVTKVVAPSSARRVQTAGLESLDIRIKDR